MRFSYIDHFHCLSRSCWIGGLGGNAGGLSLSLFFSLVVFRWNIHMKALWDDNNAWMELNEM